MSLNQSGSSIAHSQAAPAIHGPIDSVEVVVVGAGVVGLACARALAKAGHEVLILEADAGIGTGISARNSEVIHAGIYYPAGSLKALHCVRGRKMLYAFCRERNVAHRNCTKLIVATQAAQESTLTKIKAAAAANGVDDLQWLDAAQAKKLEPALACTAALLSPSTGIVDSHGFMLALLGEAEHHGAILALRSPVRRMALADGSGASSGSGGRQGGVLIEVASDPPVRLHAQWLINAGGLNAPGLAGRIDGFPRAHVPTAHFAKGNYFSLSGRAPFTRLVYPVPEPGGLGVHLTLDLGGQARFGPDVQWLPSDPDAPIDYAVDPRRGDHFYGEIRRYWPALPDGALQPDYAGVRPKISGPGEPAADFRIEGPTVHGAPGVVQLFGIESPGLTSALSIATTVAEIVAGQA